MREWSRSKPLKQSFFNFTLEELATPSSKNRTSLPTFWAKEAFKKVYVDLNTNIKQWNFPTQWETWLQEEVSFDLFKEVKIQQSNDQTTKFLFSLEDEKLIETVLIPFRNHYSLCLSTQVGCAFGCTFCFTGKKGLLRNLKTPEIVGQVLFIKKWISENKKIMIKPLKNIMYMGQGEPLHNFEAVKKASQIFLEPRGLNFAPRKISLSTVGHIPALKRWSELPPINLSVSLHAATDELRDRIMPINKNYGLKGLVKTLKDISFSGRKKISFEYIMIQGQNDREQDIHHLVELLKDLPCQINLIPTNSFPGSSFQSSPLTHIYEFKQRLVKQGLFTTVRKTKGDDILAACGQLNDSFNLSIADI